MEEDESAEESSVQDSCKPEATVLGQDLNTWDSIEDVSDQFTKVKRKVFGMINESAEENEVDGVSSIMKFPS